MSTTSNDQANPQGTPADASLMETERARELSRERAEALNNDQQRMLRADEIVIDNEEEVTFRNPLRRDSGTGHEIPDQRQQTQETSQRAVPTPRLVGGAGVATPSFNPPPQAPQGGAPQGVAATLSPQQAQIFERAYQQYMQQPQIPQLQQPQIMAPVGPTNNQPRDNAGVTQHVFRFGSAGLNQAGMGNNQTRTVGMGGPALRAIPPATIPVTSAFPNAPTNDTATAMGTSIVQPGAQFQRPPPPQPQQVAAQNPMMSKLRQDYSGPQHTNYENPRQDDFEAPPRVPPRRYENRPGQNATGAYTGERGQRGGYYEGRPEQGGNAYSRRNPNMDNDTFSRQYYETEGSSCFRRNQDTGGYRNLNPESRRDPRFRQPPEETDNSRPAPNYGTGTGETYGRPRARHPEYSQHEPAAEPSDYRCTESFGDRNNDNMEFPYRPGRERFEGEGPYGGRHWGANGADGSFPDLVADAERRLAARLENQIAERLAALRIGAVQEERIPTFTDLSSYPDPDPSDPTTHKGDLNSREYRIIDFKGGSGDSVAASCKAFLQDIIETGKHHRLPHVQCIRLMNRHTMDEPKDIVSGEIRDPSHTLESVVRALELRYMHLVYPDTAKAQMYNIVRKENEDLHSLKNRLSDRAQMACRKMPPNEKLISEQTMVKERLLTLLPNAVRNIIKERERTRTGTGRQPYALLEFVEEAISIETEQDDDLNMHRHAAKSVSFPKSSLYHEQRPTRRYPSPPCHETSLPPAYPPRPVSLSQWGYQDEETWADDSEDSEDERYGPVVLLTSPGKSGAKMRAVPVRRSRNKERVLSVTSRSDKTVTSEKDRPRPEGNTRRERFRESEPRRETVPPRPEPPRQAREEGWNRDRRMDNGGSSRGWQQEGTPESRDSSRNWRRDWSDDRSRTESRDRGRGWSNWNRFRGDSRDRSGNWNRFRGDNRDRGSNWSSNFSRRDRMDSRDRGRGWQNDFGRARFRSDSRDRDRWQPNNFHDYRGDRWQGNYDRGSYDNRPPGPPNFKNEWRNESREPQREWNSPPSNRGFGRSWSRDRARPRFGNSDSRSNQDQWQDQWQRGRPARWQEERRERSDSRDGPSEMRSNRGNLSDRDSQRDRGQKDSGYDDGGKYESITRGESLYQPNRNFSRERDYPRRPPTPERWEGTENRGSRPPREDRPRSKERDFRPTAKSARVDEGSCLRCGDPSHDSWNCPSYGNTPLADSYCYRCKRGAHLAVNCVSSQGNNVEGN